MCFAKTKYWVSSLWLKKRQQNRKTPQNQKQNPHNISGLKRSSFIILCSMC